MSDWLALAPILVVAVGAFAAMVLEWTIKDKLSAPVDQGTPILPIVVLCCAAVFAALAWARGSPPATSVNALTSHLALDSLTYAFHLTICVGGIVSTLLAGGYLREHRLERADFYTVLLWSVFGSMVLASARDFVTVFIAFETMTLASYCLVAFGLGNRHSIEAGLKYFLLGSFAAAILLFGSAFMYGATGHTDFRGAGQAIKNGHAVPMLVLIAVFLLFAGLAFAISVVPFHMWTPDVYEGAITPVTAFMSVTVKTAAVAPLVRLLLEVLGDPRSSDSTSGWPPLLAALSIGTMIYGNLAAIAQSSIKRMLAYSSIAHGGYLLIGVVAIFRAGENAVSSVTYYVMAYTVSNLLVFGSLIAFGTKGKEPLGYEDVAGAGLRHPFVSAAFTIGVFSLMGLPPTAGFFAKYYIFVAAMQTEGGMGWLVVIGLATSAIGAFYYLRVIVFLYMKEPEPGLPTAAVMKSGYIALALFISAFFVLTMGSMPSRYLEFALATAAFIP